MEDPDNFDTEAFREKYKAGIDYGLGMSNIDHENGIRYGVISQHSLASWVMGEAEPIYPDYEVEVECEHCEETFMVTDSQTNDNVTCPECGEQTWAEGNDFIELEPVGWDLGIDEDGYETDWSETLNALFVLKSPYYTECHYCSPCAPGAGDLDSPMPGGVKAYAFGPDFFDEDSPCPYPIYSVETGELVQKGPDDVDAD